MVRALASLVVWSLLALPFATGGAHADQLVELSVTGATEESRGFTVLYEHAANAPNPWSVLGKAVAAYRVSEATGTITINAKLQANTPPRVAQGPTSTQTIQIRAAGGSNILKSAFGHPDQEAAIEYSFPFTQTSVQRVVYQIDVLNLSARCGLAETPCSAVTFYLVFMLRNPIDVNFGAVGRPRLFVQPVTFFQMYLHGLSPFTDVTDVSIDGVAATRIPSGTVPLNQSPGALKWDRFPFEQMAPTAVSVPGTSEQTFDKFLGCGGGGCGNPGVRVGMPADITTGLHHVTVVGHSFGSVGYQFYGNSVTDVSGNAELLADEEFIFLNSKLQVSPDPVGSGQTMTITGTGFAPDVTLPIEASLSCCGTHILLGNVHTNLQGNFSAMVTAPPASAPFFAGVWTPSTPNGALAYATLTVPWGDATFKQKYNDAGIDQTKNVTFSKTSATGSTTTTLPGGSTTSTTVVPGSSTTTSTTLPGCGGGCDDGNPCTTDACVDGACTHTHVGGAACALPPGGLPTASCPVVPPKLDKSFDKAAELLGRALDKPRKAVRRLVKKADKLLKKTKRLTEAAELLGKIPPECADGIVEVIDDVRSRVGFVLEQL